MLDFIALKDLFYYSPNMKDEYIEWVMTTINDQSERVQTLFILNNWLRNPKNKFHDFKRAFNPDDFS